jgi:hypothetical protein
MIHYAPLRKVETEEGHYFLQGDNACGVDGQAAPTDYAGLVTCPDCQAIAAEMLGMDEDDFQSTANHGGA